MNEWLKILQSFFQNLKTTNSFTIFRKWSHRPSLKRKKMKTLDLMKVTMIAVVMCVLIENVSEDYKNS